MATRTRIALAVRSAVELSTLSEWLDSDNFVAVRVPKADASPQELEALKFEMLVVDTELMKVGSLMRAARYRPSPRPVIVIGDPDADAENDAGHRGASYIARPFDRKGLLFAVTLALAEGRTMRRFPRKLVSRLQARVDGVPSRVLDVSHAGVRLEIAASNGSALPPFFTLRMPDFNVAVMVQRVWVSAAAGAASQLWCGAALASNSERIAKAWRRFVDLTPDTESYALSHNRQTSS
jgi:AmiR/NasT family two-component response regulator